MLVASSGCVMLIVCNILVSFPKRSILHVSCTIVHVLRIRICNACNMQLLSAISTLCGIPKKTSLSIPPSSSNAFTIHTNVDQIDDKIIRFYEKLFKNRDEHEKGLFSKKSKILKNGLIAFFWSVEKAGVHVNSLS